ncbi:MAG: hypothetical protein CMJ65_04490 [Planctomycetaceae bacterium]|jgi:hypothetical protein|nr:hypothetical protein [Planctomycetaceae bacterium]MDP7274773.1 hypothetical protein [Planctomycetaceae bacterium]
MASDQQRLSYEQAALRLGLSEDQLRDLKKARRIRDYPDYGGWMFKAEEIEALALELAAEQALPAADQTADGEANRLFGTGIDRRPSTPSPVSDDLVEAAQDHPNEEKNDASGSDDDAATKEERKAEQREWKAWRRKWLLQCPVDHRGRFGHFINRNFRDDYRNTTTNPCELFLDQLKDTSSSPTRDSSGSEMRETSETLSVLSNFGCVGAIVLFFVICWIASLL